ERRAERESQMRADEEFGSQVQYLTQQRRARLPWRREGRSFDEEFRELRNVDEEERRDMMIE
uniref:2S seed storage albumin protein (Fragments) n=1 Tax=Cucurbita moschata TaxID=3662 RepID=2SS_CUCMO|nr:RecName: Full=2S seed storage albumin protein; AltName: Full=2S albumin; Contains: RecName: Full=2S albumin small chain; AltName: Full=Moschin A; Contains: RecName: Full=2S albumin large chain; AltName: Full=Moschin B [Cucurbita moschata]